MGAPIMDGGIQWDRLTEEKFERLVETLLTRYHEDRGADVDCPEGRGGDGGIDVLVRYPKRTLVYQIKFFPEGLTKRIVARKKQLEKSFEKAMTTVRPDKWYLCLPAKATNEAREYVEALPGGRAVKARLFARNHIESMLSAYPDLASWVIQDGDDHLADQVRKATFGRAVPQTLAEVDARWRDVQASDGAIDPDWDIRRVSDGHDDGVFIVPKHSHAQQRNPIELQLELKDTEAAKRVQEQLDTQRDYGTRQRVDVGSDVIERAVLSGPQWIGNWSQLDGVSYHGPASVPEIAGKKVTVTVTDSTGELLAHRVGKAIHGGKGERGISLEAEFFDALTLTVRLPTAHEARGFVDTSYDLPGHDARSAERVAELLLLIGDPGNMVNVQLDGTTLFGGSMSTATPDPILRAVLELAEDLQIIELHTHVSIPFPEEFSSKDRIDVRRLRLMLEGKRSILKNDGFTITPTCDLDPTHVVADRAMLMTQSGAMEIFGVVVPIPDVVCWNARVRPEGLEESLADIANGQTPRPFRVVAVDDSPFLTWMPARASDHDTAVNPWSLTGIKDPEVPS